MNTPSPSKKEIRRRILDARAALDSEQRHEKNAKIRDRLLGLNDYRAAQTILFYVSFRTEVDTLRLIRLSLEAEKIVALPKVNPETRTLSLYRIESLNDLVSGYQGIPEPGILKKRNVPVETLDLVVLPGVAFDSLGNRIGYGGGYYDRLLETLEPRTGTLALAYGEQMVERIPADSHDKAVQTIVTDGGVLRCR